jgi:hypothetical protein
MRDPPRFQTETDSLTCPKSRSSLGSGHCSAKTTAPKSSRLGWRRYSIGWSCHCPSDPGGSEQAKQKAQEALERVRTGAQHACEQGYERARTTSPAVLGAVAAGVVGLVVLFVVLRRRG